MKKYILPLLIILSGCDVDNSNTCSTVHIYDEPMTDNYGLTLEPSDNMHISFETLSKVYQDTMACAGMTAPAPTVAWKSFSEQYIGGFWGVYIPTGDLVWINTDPNVAERNCITDVETLKHEFIHHILHENGMGEESHAHHSPLFKQCGMGVYIKDGKAAPK